MRSARQIAATFWVAVAMMLVLAVFFAVVGGAQGPVFLVVVLVIATAFAVHELLRYRHRQELELTLDARRTRERRGF